MKRFLAISLFCLLVILVALLNSFFVAPTIAQDVVNNVHLPLIVVDSSTSSTPLLTLTPTNSNTSTATSTPTPSATPITTLTPTDTAIDYGKMVLVPASTFQMGCDGNIDTFCTQPMNDIFGGNLAELPLHSVFLDSYYIDKYETTNERYRTCVNAGRCSPPHQSSSASVSDYYQNPKYANYPVIWVDWFQADQYCKWADKRLPTDAEWEKAARGDTDTRIYPWGNSPPANGQISNGHGDTSMVGSALDGISPYGALDMVGNVQEWTNDWYAQDYYSSSPASNPLGPSTSFPFCANSRTLRNASFFNNDTRVLRLTYRGFADPSASDNRWGFRCAKSFDGSTPTPTPISTSTPPPCGTLSGVLSDNMTLAQSCEYKVTGNTLVSQGITLTIPSGTKLKFDSGTYLKIDGTLTASGTEAQPIIFTASDECQSWSGIRITSKSGNSSRIQHAIIEHGIGTLGPPNYFVLDVQAAQPTLSDVTFRYNKYPFQLSAGSGYTATIQNSIFVSNTGQTRIMFGHNIVNGNYFSGNKADSLLLACPGNTITNNKIEENFNTPIKVNDCSNEGTTLIEHNTIRGSNLVFYSSISAPVVIQYNDISEGIFSASYTSAGSWCSARLNFNNMASYTGQPIISLNKDSCEVDLTNNWWGTAITTEIDARIYDYNDNFELAKAKFIPFASTPIQGAGASQGK